MRIPCCSQLYGKIVLVPAYSLEKVLHVLNTNLEFGAPFEKQKSVLCSSGLQTSARYRSLYSAQSIIFNFRKIGVNAYIGH